MSDEARLRKRPSERFSSDEHVFDLDSIFSRLPSESVERHGLMQETVYKHGRLTSAVFSLAAGAKLEAHRLDGEAVLHVLDGRVTLSAEGNSEMLAAGQLALLGPRVEHGLEASEASRLLMHIVLER